MRVRSASEAIFDALRRGWIVNSKLERELLALVDEIVRAERVLTAVALDDAILAKADPTARAAVPQLLEQADARAKEATLWPQLDKKTLLFHEALVQYQEAWKAALKLVPQ